jgi:hypothetical protein
MYWYWQKVNVPANASCTLLLSDWPLLMALAFGPVGGFVRLIARRFAKLYISCLRLLARFSSDLAYKAN